MELHGGTIGVESEKGIGSRFFFTMTAAESDSEPVNTSEKDVGNRILQMMPNDSASEKDSVNSETQFTILTVDDETVNQQVLRSHLSLKNYKVEQVFNGKEALEYLAENEKPDLILLDIMMPGMSGYDVLKKIREEYPPAELPVVMLTAKSGVDDLVEGFKAGANDYIPKPFAKDELIARVSSHLEISEKVKSDREELDAVISELKESSICERVDQDLAEIYVEKLKKVMEREKAYLEPGLTVGQLAEKTGITGHNISYVLNSCLGINFYTFVNNYRVEEAKQLLRDPNTNKENILSISIMAGFKSKATFNTFFKKTTGMTPSAYRSAD